MNILIIEDELLIAEMLSEMLQDLGYTVSSIVSTYEKAIEELNKRQKIDLCFIDINLEAAKNGFDVARKINEEYFIPFVFLTSYSDKKTVTEAALLQPATYLNKPFSPTDLLTTVEIIRARTKINTSTIVQKAIHVKIGSDFVKIFLNDILWIKSDNNYLDIKTTTKKFVVRNSLEKFIEDLNDSSFFRTHRSFVVNLNHIHTVSGQVLLIKEDKIPLSRKFREEVLERFKP